MKANELRIGNYVRVLGNDKVIRGISQYNQIQKTQTARHYIEFDNSIPINQIHLIPIPLTEEWLLKFGFEEGLDNQFYYDPLNKDESMLFDLYYSNQNGIEIDNCCTGNIWYVHQLQNLYYILTNKELKINE